MKVFKEKTQSLIPKSFGIKDTLYLACTVLVYFDLQDPDDPLTEQDLWKTIPQELGQGGVLDMGMPKPRGEVLVTGRCFAPRGTTRAASEIRVRVGALEKKLAVFGNRSWESTAGAMKRITPPEPFGDMPVVWQNAFGGAGFEKNPLGKGMAEVPVKDAMRLPLPNIEDPEHLIGSPADRPDPASFGPIDLMWPQRFKKQGTYDDRWKRERWPHFPEDMNYEFFNVAAEDQFLPGFFRGDEAIEILNMHPDIQMIQSHLPRVRPRCFVTRIMDLKTGRPEEDLFVEVGLHIDTLWLFPSVLRGVVMYRGTTEIRDDEYGDVRWIFLASEKMHEEPRPIEHYLEEQKKVLNRIVPIDPAPFEAAQKKIGEALKRVSAIPKEIEERKKVALGKAPRMEYTPQEMAAQGKQVIRNGQALVDDMEKLAKDMHAQYGHLVRIPLEKFAPIRQKLRETDAHIDKTMVQVEEGQKKAEEVKKEVSDGLKKNVKPEYLQKAGVDPDRLLQAKPVNPWHDRGFPLVIQWRKNLEQDRQPRMDSSSSVLQGGRSGGRGLASTWERRVEERRRGVWSLRGMERDSFDLPAGLVIPRFQDATLSRVAVRPVDFSVTEKDVLVEGSDETPLFLPALEEGASVIRVGDELEAWLVEQEAGDACSVISLKDAEEKPGKEAEEATKAAPVFLIALPSGAGEEAFKPWREAYPNAKSILLPEGNTVFEARRKGTDIRKWIMDSLPTDIRRRYQLEPAMPEPGKPPQGSPMAGIRIPALDFQKMVDSFTNDVKAKFQPNIDRAMALKQEAEGKLKGAIVKAGKDPEAVLSAARSQPAPSMAAAGQQMAEKLIQTRDKVKDKGQLTPELEKRFNESADQVRSMGQEWEQQYKEGMARAEAAKEQIAKARAGEIPDSVKGQLKAAGIDPDKMKRFTREEVVEKHRKGESLEGAILSGVDLSNLDLRGIDLSMAQCQKTRFCESNLDGARLFQTIAQEADFTKASLRKVRMERGIFNKAVFKEAHLQEAEMDMAIFQEADFTKADCSRGPSQDDDPSAGKARRCAPLWRGGAVVCAGRCRRYRRGFQSCESFQVSLSKDPARSSQFSGRGPQFHHVLRSEGGEDQLSRGGHVQEQDGGRLLHAGR